MAPDDVAVVDEVQMIEDPDRGGAWTRAILGEPTKPSRYTLTYSTSIPFLTSRTFWFVCACDSACVTTYRVVYELLLL